MKKILIISVGILMILTVTLFHSCKKDKPISPTITTTDVTAISYTTATSGGTVTNEGGALVVSRGVCWNTSANPTMINSKTIEGSGLGAFVSNITNLTPNTMYYLRAYAMNTAGTSYGNQVSFTTSQVALVTLTTTAITTITQTTAVSGGNITADNGGSVITRGICWGTATNPTTANDKTTDGTGTGSFASNLTGLSGNTKYYVRAYATNSIGTAYGNEISFTTSALIPTLTTTAISSITTTTASSGGNISSDGGASVTAHGVCWNTSTGPTTSNSKTTDGTGSGSFVSSLTALTANTKYYVRAYATNSVGMAYGNEISFTTSTAITTVSDADGNVYHTVTIGTQVWTIENLKTTKYNDGTVIPLVTNQTTWNLLSTPAYCWYDNDGATNKVTYGALYNWYTINTGKLCPTGWHVPTDAEWDVLSGYLGGDVVSGGKLKESGTTHWISPNTEATNESGFTALPGGFRYNDGTYNGIGSNGYWWSSTELDASYAYYRYMIYNSGSVYWYSYYYDKANGYSVRCIKN